MIEQIADEKKQKLHLLQDLENIKDKFAELSSVMKKLELFDNIESAAKFLNDQV